MRAVLPALLLCFIAEVSSVRAEDAVIDIATRSGVTQRFLLIPGADAKAAVVLFPGGDGGLQLNQAGQARRGNNNFLVRSARLFASQGLTVAVIDAPSDKMGPPYLSGFRQSSEHATDVKAVIAWLKDQTK